jgi:hypothetical protein
MYTCIYVGMHVSMCTYVRMCVCEIEAGSNRKSSVFHCGLLTTVLNFRGDDIVFCGQYAVQFFKGRAGAEGSILEYTYRKAATCTVALQLWFFLYNTLVCCLSIRNAS